MKDRQRSLAEVTFCFQGVLDLSPPAAAATDLLYSKGSLRAEVVKLADTPS